MRPNLPSPSSRKLHGQYYTKAAIGRLLVDCLKQDEISTAIELGAGQGALIKAAQGRWPGARFVSVDIDPDNAPRSAVALRTHYVFDALRRDLPQRIGVAESSADLALCNPPFALPKWDRRYQHILSRAGLPIAGAASFGADAFFIAQNLWMLRERGELGVIVPAGLIAGSRSQAIREALLEQHEIHQVVELPTGAFSSTEVRTYLLCLQKGSGTRAPVKLRRLGVDGQEAPQIEVPAEVAAHRMDYSHFATHDQREVKQNRSRPFEVYRGTIEVAVARAQDIDLLHTTDIRSTVICWRRSRGNHVPPNAVKAERGDLLIARVGRQFFTKIGVLKQSDVPISDCVFAIRSEHYAPEELLRAFKSEGGQRWLESRARGACARYITKEDLQMFPVGEFLR